MGAIIIGGFLTLAADVFGSAEDIWEAVFSLVASLVITITGAVLLRVGKLQATWSDKLSKAVIRDREDAAEGSSPRTANVSFMGRFTEVGEKYALFILPLITILREGFEGVLFIAGVILGSPVSTIPLSVIAGIVTGVLISYLIYKYVLFSNSLLFLLLVLTIPGGATSRLFSTSFSSRPASSTSLPPASSPKASGTSRHTNGTRLLAETLPSSGQGRAATTSGGASGT